MGHHIYRLPSHLGIQATNTNGLSTTEVEYIALSTACRELIPMLELTKEMRSYHIKSHPAIPKIHCKVFKDNSGALEMARTHQNYDHAQSILTTPITTSVNIHNHHQTAPNQPLKLSQSVHEQLGDMLTKPLPALAFMKLHKTLLGW